MAQQGSGWRNWGDHPVVVIITIIAAIIGIAAFVTGKQNLSSLWPTKAPPPSLNGSPTPDISIPSSVGTPTVTIPSQERDKRASEEKAEREALERKLQEANEKSDREKALREQREREAGEASQRAERERATREEMERRAREANDKAAQEKAARNALEKQVQEKEARMAEEQLAGLKGILWLEKGYSVDGYPVVLEFELGGKIRTRTAKEPTGYVAANVTWYRTGNTMHKLWYEDVDRTKVVFEYTGTINGDKIEGIVRDPRSGSTQPWLLTKTK